jgi:hypothetical protein
MRERSSFKTVAMLNKSFIRAFAEHLSGRVILPDYSAYEVARWTRSSQWLSRALESRDRTHLLSSQPGCEDVDLIELAARPDAPVDPFSPTAFLGRVDQKNEPQGR